MDRVRSKRKKRMNLNRNQIEFDESFFALNFYFIPTIEIDIISNMINVNCKRFMFTED